jgi:hypothetical protein
MTQARQVPEQPIFAKHPCEVSHHSADKDRVTCAEAFTKVREDDIVYFCRGLALRSMGLRIATKALKGASLPPLSVTQQSPA